MSEVFISASYKSGSSARKATLYERPVSGRSDVALAITMIVATLLLLRLPDTYRDSVFVAAALAGFGFALRDFTTVWMLFLAEMPIIQLQSSLFGETRIGWTRFLLAGLTLVFLLSRKRRDFWASLTKRLGFLALVLFIFANFLSAFHLMEIEAISRSFAYCEPALVYLLTYYAASESPANIRRLVRAILVGGLCVIGLGLVEFAVQRSIIDLLSIDYSGSEQALQFLLSDRYGLGGRISSLFAQPVYAGMGFFVYALILSFYVTIYKRNFQRFVAVLAPIVGVFLLLATGSRGPLVALVPTLLALVLLRRSNSALSRTKSAVVVLIGVAVIVFGLSIFDALPGIKNYWTESVNLTSQQSSGLTGRVDLTTTLLEVFRENPILGYGPGMIQKSAFAGSARFARLEGLENQYAVILAEGGIVAGTMYLLFMLAVFGLLLKMHRTGQSVEARYYGLMSLLLFIFVFAGAASASFLGGPVIDTIMAIHGVTVAGYDTWGNQLSGTSKMRG